VRHLPQQAGYADRRETTGAKVMRISWQKRRFQPLRPLFLALFALGSSACDEAPVTPSVDKMRGADSESPERAAEPATGQPAPSEARPLPAPSAADRALAGRVASALAADPEINASTIDIVVADGRVTLYGAAPSAASREKAERVATGIEGVESVENRLAVVPGS
jgi:hypothetical protein